MIQSVIQDKLKTHFYTGMTTLPPSVPFHWRKHKRPSSTNVLYTSCVVYSQCH